MCMEEYLYCITNEQGSHCKLGYSRDPESRLSQLRTGTREDLRIAHVIAVPLGTGRSWERVLHSELGHHRVVREWFELPVEKTILQMTWFEIHYLN